MRLRGPAPASSAIVIIGRDEESDAQFGIGVWDRAIVASVIAGLGRARAAVVAPDFLFANASPPGRGGTASDAALIAATTQAGNVVFPVSTSPLLPALAQHARGVGHVAALDDQDGVYRSVPVVLDHDGRPIPAFGVAIAAAFLNVPPNRTTTSIPLDAQGRMLINYAGRWEDGPFPYLSFVDVRDAIQEGRLAELRK
jgi:CHASE2 domain-containing sensor protein